MTSVCYECVINSAILNLILPTQILSKLLQLTVVDLKPNGRNIPVTESNKKEYIEWVVEYNYVQYI